MCIPFSQSILFPGIYPEKIIGQVRKYIPTRLFSGIPYVTVKVENNHNVHQEDKLNDRVATIKNYATGGTWMTQSVK